MLKSEVKTKNEEAILAMVSAIKNLLTVRRGCDRQTSQKFYLAKARLLALDRALAMLIY
jgi:hypothetical protein